MEVTAQMAVEMVVAGGNDIGAELKNVSASYIDICEEIEASGDVAAFDEVEYQVALQSFNGR